MDDARSFDAADTGELAFAVMKQGIDESAIWVAWGGVDDHAVGFVKDDDVVILEKDIKRDILRVGVIGDRLWDDDGNLIAGVDTVSRFGGFSVEQDELLANQSLNSGA